MTDSLEHRIRELVALVMRVDAMDVRDDASPATLPQWDSLQHLKLILALEDEFGVAFSDEQIVSMIAFPRIVATVGELLNSR